MNPSIRALPKVAAALSAPPLAGALASCGGSRGPDFGSEDGRKIADLVSALADDKSKPELFKSYFVQGMAPKPAEVNRYIAHAYYVVNKPTVHGDTAT